MSKYIPVEGYRGLVRDPDTNAIINVDSRKIAAARAAKAQRRKQQNLESRVDNIEKKIDLLIDLMQQK